MDERVFTQTQIKQVSSFESDLCLPPLLFLVYPGIEGGFDVEQDQYEEDVKVVILPDRQEVTADDLGNMPEVVRERVSCVFSGKTNVIILLRFCLGYPYDNILHYNIRIDTCSVSRYKTI